MPSSKKKKKTSGPLTAAGLVRFFEDVEAKVTISPSMIVIMAVMLTVTVAVMNILFR
jgi:preprotein translocase subunit Sec61beta